MRARALSRPWIAVAVLLALVVVLVVLALSRGDDEDDLRIVRGVPSAGFPLRGDLAGDDRFLADAAAAWRRRVQRDGDRWTKGEEVVALWAGRVGDANAAVLAANWDAVLVTHDRDEPHDDVFHVQRAAVFDDVEHPVVVAFPDAVLLRDGTTPVLRRAETEGAGSSAVRVDAGLLHRRLGTALPEGALLFPKGVDPRVSTGDDRGTVILTGRDSGIRKLSPELLERLTSGEASRPGPTARRLVAALRAGASPDDEDDTTPRHPFEAPRLALVTDRTVGPLGRTLVLRTTPAPGTSRGLGRPRVVVAAERAVGEDEDEDEPAVAVLGGDDDRGTGRAPTGPALGAAYVRQEGSATPWLLVAGGEDVRRIDVLAGTRRYGEAGPVALLRAAWARADGTDATTAADVAVLGRTADGSVVVPGALGGSMPLRLR